MDPITLCAVALRAPGKDDNIGLGKCCANTTAKALFCIPVSILMVLDRVSPAPKAFATRYPTPNPTLCKATTPAISFHADTPGMGY